MPNATIVVDGNVSKDCFYEYIFTHFKKTDKTRADQYMFDITDEDVDKLYEYAKNKLLEIIHDKPIVFNINICYFNDDEKNLRDYKIDYSCGNVTRIRTTFEPKH